MTEQVNRVPETSHPPSSCPPHLESSVLSSFIQKKAERTAVQDCGYLCCTGMETGMLRSWRVIANQERATQHPVCQDGSCLQEDIFLVPTVWRKNSFSDKLWHL